jgi:hypothetical protein
LLLYRETLRSPAAPPLFAATTLAFATSVVDEIALARTRVRRKYMGPLGKDLVSIAVIVAVLRQSSEAGEGVKTERTNPSRSHHSALTRGYLLLQIDRVSLLAILRVVGAPFD